MKTSVYVGALATLFLVFVQPVSADPRANAVFERICERLQLMKSVAAWKWANGVPIEDLDREAVVLQKSVDAAVKLGIDPDGARSFFDTQIMAAKEIQHCWIERWESGHAVPPTPVPDLKTDIRPRLLTIGDALLSNIKTALVEGTVFDQRHLADFAERTDIDCLQPSRRDELLLMLGRIRLKTSHVRTKTGRQ